MGGWTGHVGTTRRRRRSWLLPSSLRGIVVRQRAASLIPSDFRVTWFHRSGSLRIEMAGPSLDQATVPMTDYLTTQRSTEGTGYQFRFRVGSGRVRCIVQEEAMSLWLRALPDLRAIRRYVGCIVVSRLRGERADSALVTKIGPGFVHCADDGTGARAATG